MPTKAKSSACMKQLLQCTNLSFAKGFHYIKRHNDRE